VVKIEVNGKSIEAKKGEMLLAALRRAGIKVPTLCSMENLLPSGACRVCVVDVEGQRNLVPSCAYPVADGMKVQTHSAHEAAEIVHVPAVKRGEVLAGRVIKDLLATGRAIAADIVVIAEAGGGRHDERDRIRSPDEQRAMGGGGLAHGGAWLGSCL